MKKYTNQTAFNKVYRHLLRQNKQAVDDVGSCLYRGPDGLQCAAGCLISDKTYTPDMEDRTIDAVLERFDVPELEGVGVVLLKALQGVHDMYEPAMWQSKLENVADRFNLTVPKK